MAAIGMAAWRHRVTARRQAQYFMKEINIVNSGGASARVNVAAFV